MTSRASPSSRAESRHSRQTRRRRRSPRRRAPTSSRRGSDPCSAECSSQGHVPATCAGSLRSSPTSSPVASLEPLWWPPAKIVGRYLAPFLASIAGAEAPSAVPAGEVGAVEVERVLDSDAIAGLDSSRLLLRDASDDEPRVEAVMTRTVVVVAPEDTLGEAAEQLLRRRRSSCGRRRVRPDRRNPHLVGSAPSIRRESASRRGTSARVDDRGATDRSG